MPTMRRQGAYYEFEASLGYSVRLKWKIKLPHKVRIYPIGHPAQAPTELVLGYLYYLIIW